MKLAEWLKPQPVEQRRAELLPRGLEALLEESWDRLQRLPEDLRGLAEKGLGVVAVAREALPRSILSAVAGWKEVGDPDRFLTVARSFLLEEVGPGSREKAWRPFHESFRRFILDKLGVDRERALHSRLAEQLCQWPVAEAEGRFRWSYVLRHGVTHWLETEQWEQARKLYTDMGYLEKRCQEAGVLSVEEALKSVVQKAPERERGTARALLRAIQAGSHVLKGGAKALPSYVYNWLRCRGWEKGRLEEELRSLNGLTGLWLLHPVRAAVQGRTLEGHGARVTGCAVTPDGRHVVSTSEDRTLKVWDVNSGQCLHTLYGEYSFTAVVAGSEVICAGDKAGNVWILERGPYVSRMPLRRTHEISPVIPMNFIFPPPLIEAYRSKKLALCIGSGLSLSEGVQGKFPRWDQLPLRFLEVCERQGVPDFDAETFEFKRTQFTKRMRLEVMLAELGTLSTALGRGYQSALNDIFRPADAAPGDVHEVIAQLGVSAILTTNYDPLIEELQETPRRQAYTWKEADRALNDLKSGRRVLLKIHGTAERHDTVVLTEREYDRARSDKSYQSVLSHLLQEYTVLFLGYGMNDPFDIDLVLKWNAEVFNAAAPRHFALLKDPSGTDSDRYLREHNIQAIPYSDYAALPGILEVLQQAGSQPP